MYHRWQSKNIEDALKTRRVIVLSGPRQCGKTTLAKEYAKGKNIYRTLDDLALLESARMDPHGFVHHDDNLLIIDEIQRAPELLQAIKMDVDKNQKKGRFLLTGSANIQSIPSAKESLAGRVRHLRLRPLSQGEIEGSTSTFLRRMFQSSITSSNNNVTGFMKSDYIDFAIQGGYPEPLTLSKWKHKKEWYEDYLNSLILKDLKDISNIKKTDSVKNLINVMGAWSSKFIDLNAIGSGLSLSRASLLSYVNSLEMLYLIERLPAWSKTHYDRVGKKEKLFMVDAGLMSHLLNWTKDKILFDGNAIGILIETFVFNQLSVLIDVDEDYYQMFHYRDKDKREIDFIIENEQGDLIGIEVKAGSSISYDSFKHMHWFKENLAKDKNFKGIILYAGEHAIPFKNNFWALPISDLWSY
jgi:predicted AAA+ superfamily ATPase